MEFTMILIYICPDKGDFEYFFIYLKTIFIYFLQVSLCVLFTISISVFHLPNFFQSFFFFSFIFISWRLITLQYCSGFCHTLTWISNGFTCIPHPNPPSHLPLYLIPLGLPSAICNPMDYSTPGLPVLHHLLEFAQSHVHWVCDAIKPSHPLSPPSPTAFSPFPASGSFPVS